MQLQLGKSPQAGDVPPQVGGDLPYDTTANLPGSSANNCGSQINLFNGTKLINTTTASHHNNIGSSNSTTTSSRTHVLRSSTNRKLLHRCPFGNCCKGNRSSGQYSRSAYRNTNNNNSSSITTTTYANIPFETKDTMTSQTAAGPYPVAVVPDPSQVSGAHGGLSFYNNNNHQSHRESWHPNIPVIHNADNDENNDDAIPEVNTRRAIIARGILRRQQLRVQPSYRKRAINYMMTQLQVRGNRESDDKALLEAVKRHIERLEDQVYTSANSEADYVDLLAIKLGAIMDSLYTCHTARVAHPQDHAHAHAYTATHATSHQHQQPTCV